MVLAAMQPTYLPWMGYFDLIDQSDVFVILDTVQFEKQSWQQRNRIKTKQGPQWLIVPVQQDLGQRIRDVRIAPDRDWRRKHWLSLEMSYRKAPYWSDFSPPIQEIYDTEWSALAELNVRLIETICSVMGISGSLIRSSTLDIQGTRTEFLVNLCRFFHADRYLSPSGSFGYMQEDGAFQGTGIEVDFQTYNHPEYAQRNMPFTPYMSVLDLIFNVGPAARDIIRSGRHNLTMSEMSRALASTQGPFVPACGTASSAQSPES